MMTKKERQKYNREYYQKNIVRLRKKHRAWMRKNGKEWYKKQKKRGNFSKEYWRNFRKTHPDYYKKLQKKRRLDPKARLDDTMSCSIGMLLKGSKNRRKWQSLVGYSQKDLISHLEKQFDENMSWSNYGSYWEVDHVKPKSLFNYSCSEDPDFKKCWSLDNLRPLEKSLNRKKSNKYVKPKEN